MIYINKNSAISFERFAKGPDQRGTACELVEILSYENGKPVVNPVYRAEVTCDSRDRFTKESGRKLALKKVLKEAGYDKDMRKIVWTAYFNRFPTEGTRFYIEY